jgi:hypothetical protein
MPAISRSHRSGPFVSQFDWEGHLFDRCSVATVVLGSILILFLAT